MTLLSDQHAGLTLDANRGSPVVRWPLFLVLGGFVGLLVPHLTATAHACSCLPYLGEHMVLTVSTIERVGGGDVAEEEFARWEGYTDATAGETGEVHLQIDKPDGALNIHTTPTEEGR